MRGPEATVPAVPAGLTDALGVNSGPHAAGSKIITSEIRTAIRTAVGPPLTGR